MLGTGIDNVDAWNSYVHFKKEHFYLLENQFFNQITCRVNVPSIVDGWVLLKDQMKKKVSTAVQFEEEFSRFTMHVHKGGRVLTFERPKFNVKLISNDAASNQQIENEIKIVQEGFQKQIIDVERVIEGIFDEYRLAKRLEVGINKISVKGKKVHISYSDNNNENEREEIYTDTLRHVILKDHGQAFLERNDKFKKVDDKLILESSDIVVKRDSVTVENSISIEYQSLKRIDLPQLNPIHIPRKISDSTKTKINNVTQQVVLDIYLDRCYSR